MSTRNLKTILLFAVISILAIAAIDSFLQTTIPPYTPLEVADNRANGNSYPANLANAPLNSSADPWNMGNRECTSYIAWMVYSNYHDMPTTWTQTPDAKNWPALATQSGFVVGSVPKVGSVAIAQPGTLLYEQQNGNSVTMWTAGSTGHAMWVEQVNNDNTILVSQYNADNSGQFSYSTVDSGNFQYIYFNQRAQ